MKPAAYAVNHPVTGAAMVFIDRERAIERAASFRSHATPLYTAGQLSVFLNNLLAANAGMTAHDMLAAINAL
jgi:hypothetical protein